MVKKKILIVILALVLVSCANTKKVKCDAYGDKSNSESKKIEKYEIG